MALEFLLPEIGEGVMEGEIVEWHVKLGEKISHDSPLVSILTDKATVEISASFEGVISALKGQPGDVVPVGSALLSYESATGEASPTPAPVAATMPKDGGQAQVLLQGPVAQQIEFPLPEIGEGVMEGEIVEWLVAAGDQVAQDQPVVSILTDKATVEITAPVQAKVLEVFGKPGEVMQVGGLLMKLEAMVEGQAAAAPAAQTLPPAPSAPPAVIPAAPAASKPTPSPSQEVDPAQNPSISAYGTPLATPAVRKLAAEKGIDLRGIKGSGENHRITREDLERVTAARNQVATPVAVVEKAAPAATPTPAEPVAKSTASPAAGERREKIRGLRKAIYNSMTKSKRTVPHFTFVDEVEMDALVAMRENLKDLAAASGVKLNYLPFIVKAVVAALKKFPIMNARVDDESGEIVYLSDYNIGIATATPNGLTVPVVKAVDRKSILQIAREITEVSARARNLKSSMEDISGGTFTITSLGRIGGLLATPIINHPEVAIMGIHNLQERAVVRKGQIVIRQMMNLSLSFDHRVVDGDVGATFAQEVKATLENPSQFILNMV